MSKAATGTAGKVNQNRITMVAIITVVCILMLVLFFQGRKMAHRIDSNDQRISGLQEEIEAENQRTDEIKELQEYMQSDEYLEKVAKDKLGLVTDGEIIFKEAE